MSTTNAPAENSPELLAEGYEEETKSALMYDLLAGIEGDERLRHMFSRLGDAARAQAAIWAQRLHDHGITPPDVRLGHRERIVLGLARRLGIAAARPALVALKVRGLSAYAPRPSGGHGPVSRDPERIGRRHRTGSGNLRAAVFGVNDGLVSNASLIMGMAGAAADARTLLLAGVAGLLAGAFSMAAGEYVSVRSQREVFEYQIGLEEAELREYPDEEAQELAVIYEAKGLPPEEAARLARTLIADPARALDTLAREELGLNPDDLGSPWGAAVSSFTAFAAGAAIPLAPLLLAAGPHAIRGSVAAAGLALFAVGAALSLFTGRAALASGLRMLAIGAAAGTTTYLLGALIAGGSAI